jgi:hypothetical protein
MKRKFDIIMLIYKILYDIDCQLGKGGYGTMTKDEEEHMHAEVMMYMAGLQQRAYRVDGLLDTKMDNLLDSIQG